ncbi:tetratricopeptide repeat protein [Geomonas anaerohicana]|nr:tetratricopeptide repeat protein [Geomonas anaerohicana]
MNPELAQMETTELVHIGQEELEARRFSSALRYLQAAMEQQRTPDHVSLYALALAQATGNIKTAVALCQEAIKREPRNSSHFLRLGTIYLVAGRKKEAIRSLNLGLRVGKNPAIMKLLQSLGHRESPVIPFLSRGNPLNKYLGKIRSSLFRR